MGHHEWMRFPTVSIGIELALEKKIDGIVKRKWRSRRLTDPEATIEVEARGALQKEFKFRTT
jgi:hypothetical protein